MPYHPHWGIVYNKLTTSFLVGCCLSQFLQSLRLIIRLYFRMLLALHVFLFPCRFQYRDLLVMLLTGYLSVCPIQ